MLNNELSELAAREEKVHRDVARAERLVQGIPLIHA